MEKDPFAFDEDDVCSSHDPVIPIRTWATGSPFKVTVPSQEVDFDANQNINSAEIQWGEKGLENYFFGDDPINLPQDDEEEEGDEEDEEYEDDEQSPNEDEENEGEGDEYEEDYEDGDAEGDEEEEEGEGEEDDAEDDEGEESGRDDVDEADLDYQRLFQSKNTPQKSVASHQSHHSQLHQQQFASAYQELLQYMAPPQVEPTQAMKTVHAMKNKLFIASGMQPPHQAEEDEEVDEDEESDGEVQRRAMAKEIKRMVRKKSKEAKKPPKKNKNFKGKNPFIGNSAKKKSKESVLAEPRRLTEVEERHRAMLADLSSKRKQEEDELLRLANLAEQKRKKFKEALLEKALKARQQQPSEEEDKKVAGVKTPNQILMTDEDLKRREDEKRECVAAVRRKFKEQHKKVLNDLLEKKKNNELKAEQELLLEEMKRKSRKKKIERMVAMKALTAEDKTTPQKVLAEDDTRAHSAEASSGRESKVSPGSEGKSRSVAVGSGLALVRQRTSVTQPSYDRLAKKEKASLNVLCHNEVEVEEEESAGDDSAEGKDETAKKAARAYKKKISEHLKQLAEQKKKEEADKKKIEERQRRRMQLLSQRIAAEAAERKLMSQEDSPKHHLSHADKSESSDKPAPAKKITSEMAEAMAERLRQKSLQTRTTEPAKEKEPTKLPPRPKRVSADVSNKKKLQQPNEEDDDDDSSGENAPNVGSSSAPTGYSASTSSSASTIPARDFNDWKRKNGCPPESKVFCMTGWYPCVKQALLDRGWVFNPDPQSPFCHLKWTLRSVDVNQETLQPWQLTNHYLKNVAITTKAGLIKSLQSMVWLADVDAKDIIPRGYDLSIHHEMQAFIDDFRCQKAEQLLKKLYLSLFKANPPTLYSKKDAGVFSPPCSARDPGANQPVDEDDETVEIPPMPPLAAELPNVNPVVFEAVCAILESQLRPYDDTYLDEPMPQNDINSCLYNSKMVGNLEWELISTYSMFNPVRSLPFPAPDPVDGFLAKEEEPEGGTRMTQQQVQRERRKLLKLQDDAREEANERIQKVRSMTTTDLQRVHNLLCRLTLYHRGQHGMNGDASVCENIWIVKPAAKSRGRGITTFNDLPKLLKYVEAGSGLSTQWIVQKYMENPLIIAKRKFDMRQWVLVTDWNPLTIYFYDECYARFSVEEYTTDSQDLENAYVHLVNNSIGKNSENFNKVITAENGVTIDGFMWSFEDLGAFLQFQTGGVDVLRSKIHPRMKDIAKWSLMCASEMIEHRKNSWELYGFDYMVDSNYNAWLIEINSSPACDYSTKVTERYVQKALVELLSVVLDVREWEAQPKKSRGTKPDTGGWHCIYTGTLLDLPVGSFGTEMSLKGEAVKVRGPKQPSMPVATITPGGANGSVGGYGGAGGPLARPGPQPPASSAHPGFARPSIAKLEVRSTGANSTTREPVAFGSKKLTTGSARGVDNHSENVRNREEGGSSSPEPQFDDSDGESQEGLTKTRAKAHPGPAPAAGGVQLGIVAPVAAKGSKHVRAGSNAGVSVPMKVLTLDLGL